MSRLRRWLAIVVVLVAVPAIMATSPEPDPIQQEKTEVAIAPLDAETPGRVYEVTVEATGIIEDRSVLLSFNTEEETPTDPALRITRTPLDAPGPASVTERFAGGEPPIRDLEDEGSDADLLDLGPCPGSCTVRARVAVELADPAGEGWNGDAVVVAGLRNAAEGDVSIDIRELDEPVSTSLEERTVGEVDLLSSLNGPTPHDAVVLEVSGSPEAVRRSQFLVSQDVDAGAEPDPLRDEQGTKSVAVLAGVPATARGFSQTGIPFWFGCDDAEATCTERAVLVVPGGDGDEQPCVHTSGSPKHLTVSWVADPVEGVEVRLVPAGWLAIAIDHEDPPQGSQPGRPAPLPDGAPVDIPPGSTLYAQARSASLQGSGCNRPQSGLLAVTSTGETIEDAAGLARIETCPADATVACTAWVDLELAGGYEDGTVDAILLSP